MCMPLSPQVPGPKRGEIVRQIGQALRDNLDNLGRLVCLCANTPQCVKCCPGLPHTVPGCSRKAGICSYEYPGSSPYIALAQRDIT